MSSRSPITSHVLDTAVGKPAAGVPLELFYQKNITGTQQEWRSIAKGITDPDGRCSTLLNNDFQLNAGYYKMNFDLAKYYSATSQGNYFYPYAEVVFQLSGDATTLKSQHYHIPLLLSPFGYTTYRGS